MTPRISKANNSNAPVQLSARKKLPSESLLPSFRHSSETEIKLLAVATKLFADKGFAATSVKDISDAAQLNVSLISYHFGGKEGLFRACIEQFGRGRLETAKRLLQPATTLEEFRIRLKVYLDEVIVVYLQNPDVIKILHSECERGPTSKLAHEVFQETFIAAFNTLVDYVAQAQMRGLLVQTTNPLLSATFVFGSTLHILRTHEMGEKIWDRSIRQQDMREELIDGLISIFLNGLSHRQSDDKKPSNTPDLNKTLSKKRTLQGSKKAQGEPRK